MNLTVQDHLVGLSTNAEFWSKGQKEILEEIVRASHGVTGLVVLYSKEEQAFLESASIGYDDSDFFYEFLARGVGNFEKLEASFKPMVFQRSNGFNLFRPESVLAVVSRVYGERMYGFVLIELVTDQLLSLVSWVVSLFASRIAKMIDHKVEKVILTTPPIYKQSHSENLSELLLSGNIGWQEKIKIGYRQKVFSLNAELGSGRKQVLKYIHRKMEISGELVFLNLVPHKLIKLEKSVQEWMQIAGPGFVVIENSHLLSTAQQRFYWELLKQENPISCFVFFENPKEISPEVFAPFAKMLREIQILVPTISFLEKEKRLSILSGLIKEVGSLHNIQGLTVSMESMDFLLEKSDHFSLEEIRNVLEFSVLKCKGTSLQKSDIEAAWSDSNKDVSILEYEDLNLRKSVEALERQKILLALKLFSGNQMRMAKALGISRGSLQYKMKQMELL